MANPYQFGTKSAETAVLQRVLTQHQPPFDTKGADGIYGKDTRDAVQAAQEFYGLSPADGVVRTPLLVELGIVAPQTSNPITDFLTGLAVKAALNQLKGYLQMGNLLVGAGTITTGVVMIVVGVASLLSVIIPGLGAIPGFSILDPSAAVNSITTGFGFIFLRRAIANATGK